MRDLLVTLIVFGSLPLILRKPFIGVLVWTWLSLMNPHRLCYGFAIHMSFALIVAITLMVAMLISKERKRLPVTALVGLLGFWWFWLLVTTFTAFYPDRAWGEWDRSWKIMLLTFLIAALLKSRERIDALVWVIVVSLGFYGIKGGIFTLLGGGVNHVLGPPGSFIAGNTEIGLAMVMTVPLMRYLQLTSRSKWVRIGMIIAMGLTLVAILGTQSRGGLVGMAAMIVYLAFKSRNKAGLILLLILALPLGLLIMPESWFIRMDTIAAYQRDGSAMGRINAWWTAWHMALDHPFMGGGFGAFLEPPTFLQYAPNPSDRHDVHSIFFEALGEHGFVGFFTFTAMLLVAWINLNQVIRFGKRHPGLAWMRDLASMTYVSIIGYAVSGLFLGLAMFDYYYTLLAITVGLTGIMMGYARDGVPRVTEPPVAEDRGPERRLYAAARVPRRDKRLVFGVDLAGWFDKL